MLDPSKAAVVRESFQRAFGVALLLALLGLLVVAGTRTYMSAGKMVEGTVVRIGTYPEPLGTGESPILTVRLSNGSVRQVSASWSAVGNCVPGNHVSLLQQGNALQVGLRGCRQAKPSG
jgi:hypothetical protein